jgi:isocitrate/isopropylmalate dehydrogenase
MCLLPGDGIGPEMLNPAVSVSIEAAQLGGLEISLQQTAIGRQILSRIS